MVCTCYGDGQPSVVTEVDVRSRLYHVHLRHSREGTREGIFATVTTRKPYTAMASNKGGMQFFENRVTLITH